MTKTNKKHIAVLGIKGLPSKGGGERVAEAIINETVNSGFKVTVYVKNDYQPKEKLPKNVNVVSIRHIKGKHLSAFSYGLFSAFHALFFASYDLIHLHYADFGFIVPLLRIRYKVIGTSHGAEYNRDKWGKFAKTFFKLFEKLFCKYLTICTSVSKSLANYYTEEYKRKVFFIPNGVYFNNIDYSNKSFYKKFGLAKNGYILFAAGRIIPTKGLEYLLEANKNLNLKMPVIVAGNIEDNNEYKKKIDALHSENVNYIGFIENKEELFNLIGNCKIFVFPSTYEAMSMVLLEVASQKKVLVCSDIIQNVDALEDNAVYFKSANVESLQQALTKVLNNFEYYQDKSVIAYNWVKKNRNWKTITQEYISIYNKLLSK